MNQIITVEDQKEQVDLFQAKEFIPSVKDDIESV
jgi:hypothetical protein